MKSFFWENLRIAMTELWGHKTRSILTGTGIVIGIIAVSLMSTLINGVDGLLGSTNLDDDIWVWNPNNDNYATATGGTGGRYSLDPGPPSP